jgi:hypothetical protein
MYFILCPYFVQNKCPTYNQLVPLRGPTVPPPRGGEAPHSLRTSVICSLTIWKNCSNFLCTIQIEATTHTCASSVPSSSAVFTRAFRWSMWARCWEAVIDLRNAHKHVFCISMYIETVCIYNMQAFHMLLNGKNALKQKTVHSSMFCYIKSYHIL